MKKNQFFSRIRAAYNLSAAFEDGKLPRQADLDSLGIPASAKNRFKR